MTTAEFVHLHNHTEYSLLDGATRLTDEKGNPSEFIKAMAAAKFPALAITDHGNLFGAIEFYQVCTEVGINPIIGIEAYLAPESRLDRKGSPSESAHHITLLSTNLAGYKNLMKLTSQSFLEGYYYKPRLDREILAKHSEGLVALTGCLKGEVSSALLREQPDKAAKALDDYRAIFGKDNVFVELMDHGLPDQRKVFPRLVELAKKFDAPLVATNDCHYFRKDDHFAHDVLLCIGTGKTLNDPHRLKYNAPEFYYKAPQEMMETFKEVPQALRNTLSIAERCRLSLTFNQILLPRYDVPVGESPEGYLEKLCLEGLKKRFGHIKPEYKTRLDYELSIIRKMGFSTYFLIVWDFIHYARRQGIPVGPGRGSGAGALTAYALNITNIDPIQNGLLFERFLNPERRSMPDLDIDFSDDGREQVIEYVRQKYGEACVAQIITFGSMLARLVVRDVGRVLDMPLPEVDKVTRLIPRELGITIHSALQQVPDLQNLYKTDPNVKKLLDLAQRLEGLKRHTGVHAAGTIIAAGALTEHVPLAKGSREVVTTQYNDESVLKLGLLKVDFLGLRTLTVIRDAVKLVRERHAPEFDIEHIPLDDAATFKLLAQARTAGVFQLESGGMRDLLRKLKPTTLSDVVALISLYRPGPMGSGMLDEFVARKHARSKVVFDHPLLEPLLKDTYGIIVYQEQVMQIAQVLAGYTPGQADLLRKAMGKKIQEILDQQRDTFLKGCKDNNVDKKIAEKVFDLVVQFGGYGFNKSHASAYGLVSYQTAFLKANYPTEFMAAVLTSEIGHSNLGSKEVESKLVTYMGEAQEMGIEILQPDVQKSVDVFSIETPPTEKESPAIRFGLLAVKNVGDGAVASLLEARRTKGPFASLDDLCARVDTRQVNRKVLESLVKAGALDGFRPVLGTESDEVRLLELCRWRSQLHGDVGDTLGRATSAREETAVGQGALFDLGGVSKGPPRAQNGNAPAEWSEHELLANEKEVLGFYLSGHPLARYRRELASYTTHTLGKLPESGIVRVAGMIVNTKKTVTKSGHAMSRFKLEDLEGEVECVVFPKTYTADLARALVAHEMIVVKGRVETRMDEKNILVEEAVPLRDARARFVKRVVVRLSTAGLAEDRVAKIQRAAAAHPGACRLCFELSTPTHGTYRLATEHKVAPTDGFVHEMENLLGRGSVDLQA
ncbi:MAG TPA: DNA polymerase III subunit alpha [Elusimicrobiota bacterium]|jgi:DNA polymerase-3 subunit alpha|nr:DNA polymerase III subunit alpha [Elusimicrobiota bacterium]